MMDAIIIIHLHNDRLKLTRVAGLTDKIFNGHINKLC